MLKNYLKIALRALFKDKGYSSINIAGLAVGMTGILLISMYVINELSYENFHAKRDRIYRIAVDFGQEDGKIRFAGAMSALGPALVEQVPGVEQAARLKWDPNAKFVIEGESFQERNLFFADPSLFDVFTFPLRSGDPVTALQEPFSVVLTEKMAHKYFGSEDPLGEVIHYRGQPLQVTGVLQDVPANTHLRPDILISHATLEKIDGPDPRPWTQVGKYLTYILLAPQTSPLGLIDKMNELLLQNTSEFFTGIITFRLEPLPDIYLKSAAVVDICSRGNPTYVYIFMTIAVLVLIIACFNYINLSTARAVKRFREVGVRKTLGAARSQLVAQFLVESLLIAVLAISISLVLFEIVYPLLNDFLQNRLSVAEQNYSYLYVVVPGVIFIVGLLAGSYPAWYVARFQPAEVITGRKAKSSYRSLSRKILVTTQFAISVALIIGVSIIYLQLDFVKTTDPGFVKDDVLLVSLSTRNDRGQQAYTAFKNTLQSNPDVLAVSGAYMVPGASSRQVGTIRRADRPDDESVSMQTVAVDVGIVSTLGLTILEGRGFSSDFPGDQTGSVLLNQQAVAQLKLEQPLGTVLSMPGSDESRDVQIIGVVKDFHLYSMQQKIAPALLYIQPDNFYYTAIRIRPGREADVMPFIESAWQDVMPEAPFSYQYLDDVYNGLYRSEEKIGLLVLVFSGLAIFVSCLGLLGLVTFMTERRTKEIGVRKVLGASVASIIGLLAKDFLLLVGIANAIAWPVAWTVMRRWLDNFAYRTDISLLIFLVAALLTGSVALLTVGWRAYRAATIDPVKSLKYE